MKLSVPAVALILVLLPAGHPAARQQPPSGAAPGLDAAAVIAKCAEAMGGAAAIQALRTVRAEVVYPDHDATAVIHELKRPNQMRTERRGSYVLVFDGRRASYQNLDPAKQVSGPRVVTAEQMPDLDVDIAWFIPAFFDYPAEYLGPVDAGGVMCPALRVALPLGARVTYLLDPATFLVKTIAVDVTMQGRAIHMEREWRDHRVVQGLRYPSAMTYAGRDKTTHVARIASVTVNPPFDSGRFSVPDTAR